MPNTIFPNNCVKNIVLSLNCKVIILVAIEVLSEIPACGRQALVVSLLRMTCYSKNKLGLICLTKYFSQF